MAKEPIRVIDTRTGGHHEEFLEHLLKYVNSQEKAQYRFLINEKSQNSLHRFNLPGRCEVIPYTGKEETEKFTQERLQSLVDELPSGENVLIFPRINEFIPLLRGLQIPNDISINVSGVLFGPLTASRIYGGGLKDYVGSFREIRRIKILGKRKLLDKLFVLNDRSTALFLNDRTSLPGGVHSISDPVSELTSGNNDTERLRSENNVPDRSVVFSIVGALRKSKGVLEALAGFRNLSDENLAKPVTLLLAGEVDNSFKGELERTLSSFKMNSRIRLITDFRRLNKTEFERALLVTDYFLVPNTRAFNSSGVIGWAARLGKPVIASNSGLIGHLIKEYGLGAGIDIENPNSWLEVIKQALGKGIPFSENGADNYLKKNSISAFCSKLLNGGECQ